MDEMREREEKTRRERKKRMSRGEREERERRGGGEEEGTNHPVLVMAMDTELSMRLAWAWLCRDSAPSIGQITTNCDNPYLQWNRESQLGQLTS